jgi:uncharacterized protein (TIGR02246 family)
MKGDFTMRRIILTATLGLAGLALALGQAPTVEEDKAFRAAVDSYTAAINKGDLDGLLAHIADDADFINDAGKQYKGKASLAELFKQSLADLKGHKLTTTITSLHFLRPDVVTVDGKADITAPDGTTDSGRFTAIWTKVGGKWLLSSVRDLPDPPAAPDTAPAQLKQLEWLVGDWVHEDPTFVVQVGGRWALNKSFLLLEYTVKGKGGDDLTVAQYFGWDPMDGVIRSWFFDSQGGYGGGDWERQGNTWTAPWSGVLSEGQTASSVNSITFIDDKSFLFRSVDREIDGLPMADVEVKFVRKTAGK